MTSRTAACSCGQLRVTCEGEPVRISMCHCLECQKRTGSTYGVQARWPATQVAVDGRSSRFAQLLGESRLAWIAAVVLQALPFALGHAYQGPVGVVAIFFSGLITGTGSLVWGRNLWPVIIAHGLQDTVGFYALYAGLANA